MNESISFHLVWFGLVWRYGEGLGEFLLGGRALVFYVACFTLACLYFAGFFPTVLAGYS